MSAKSYVGRDLEAMAVAVNYHQWILDTCRPFIRGRVAEVGAGSGTFTRLLMDAGLEELTAFEPAENMYRQLAERVAGQGPITLKNAIFPCHRSAYAGRFDTVFYVNVLEHIANDRAEVRCAGNTLSPGGRLILFVPALSWLYGVHDREVEHHRRYHKRDLVHMLEEEGYRVQLARYFDLPGILPWLLMYRILKLRLQSGHADLYDRIAVPIVRRIEALVAPPIGKNLLVVAERHGD